jgi:hypothetical protein
MKKVHELMRGSVQAQQAYASKDITYNIFPLLVTNLVESWIILVLACIPPLRYSFVKAYQKTRAAILKDTSGNDSRRQRSRLPGDSGAAHLSSLQGKSEAWTEAWKRPQSTVKDFDNESQEEILPHDEHRMGDKGFHANGDPGITITQDFELRYEANSQHSRSERISESSPRKIAP